MLTGFSWDIVEPANVMLKAALAATTLILFMLFPAVGVDGALNSLYCPNRTFG
jgi:hypothetical protein